MRARRPAARDSASAGSPAPDSASIRSISSRRSATLPPRTLPSMVTSHTRSADVALDEHVARHRLEFGEQRTPVDDDRRAQRVVDDDRRARSARDRRRPSRANGPRRGERDGEHREHAQEHQQQISDAQRAAVLLLGAKQVARRGEVDARADAAPHQMDEERHRDRGAEREVQWREKAHGSCWRAANARRSGTPKGASVETTS